MYFVSPPDKDILMNVTENSPSNLPKLFELENKNIFQYLSVCKNLNLVESNISFHSSVLCHSTVSSGIFSKFPADFNSFVLENYKAIKINGKLNVQIEYLGNWQLGNYGKIKYDKKKKLYYDENKERLWKLELFLIRKNFFRAYFWYCYDDTSDHVSIIIVSSRAYGVWQESLFMRY